MIGYHMETGFYL